MELTTKKARDEHRMMLFMMSKIQNLNGTHNTHNTSQSMSVLFMMSKIQNLNGTHNDKYSSNSCRIVVYDVKDTKFEWNSQRNCMLYSCESWLFMMSKIQNLNGTHNCIILHHFNPRVVYDVKDTQFEWNSQLITILFAK